MNLPDIPLLGLLKDRMSWLNARQNVLSQNVANADSPGYGARDLKPVDFEQLLRGTGRSSQFQTAIMTTDPRHIAVSSVTQQYEAAETPDVDGSPNGNTVSLEQEMIKVADTQAQYQAATNIYSKAMNMMRTAIGH